jgi:hypothetical protein
MELMIFALSGLFLGVVWQFMLKKTVLDYHRDQLFDLRDELREEFIEKGWDLSAPIYKKLRDLINGYLRFTESYSFWETFMLERMVHKNNQLTSALNRHHEKTFQVSEVSQRDFVSGLRHRAAWIIMRYMILSSGPLVLVLLAVAPLFVVFVTALAIGYLIRMGSKSLASKLEQAGGVLAAFIRYVLVRTARLLWDEGFVEELSFRQRVKSDYTHATAYF